MDCQFWGCTLEVLERAEDHLLCRMPCAGGGSGLMDRWPLFPGIELLFCDFNAQTCFSQVEARPNVLEFNHCRRGRYECRFENQTYAYLGPGEVAVNTLDHLQQWSGFPLGEYAGLSLMIDLDQAEAFWAAAPCLAPDLSAIRGRLWGGLHYVQAPARGPLAQCLEGLYQDLPRESRLPVYRLRVLELLELLRTMPLEKHALRAYLPREKRERMDLVRAALEQDREGRLTLPQLARAHGMGVSALKEQFLAVYGLPPMTFRSQCRMRRAARLLTHTELSVAEIAGRLGYENASKFSAAFRRTTGEAPALYRKNHAAERSAHGPAE